MTRPGGNTSDHAKRERERRERAEMKRARKEQRKIEKRSMTNGPQGEIKRQ